MSLSTVNYPDKLKLVIPIHKGGSTQDLLPMFDKIIHNILQFNSI